MPGGRPTKYDPKFIDSVDEYLATRQDEEYQLVKSQGSSSTSFENKIRVRLPTLEGFAQFIGVNNSTIYEWEKHHGEFSNALYKIREEQRKRLLDKGLSGDYNPVIAKLVLSANHGMAEKQEVKTTPDEETQATLTTHGEQIEKLCDEFEEKFKKELTK